MINFFKKYFGGCLKVDLASANNTIERLDDKILMLEKLIKYKQGKIEIEKQTAKKLMNSGNKQEAIQCMKKIKQLENDIKSSSKKITNLNISKETIETSIINSDIFEEQKHANIVIKNLVKNNNMTEIDDTMIEMEENIKDVDDVSKSLQRPLTKNENIDDKELEKDLENLVTDDVININVNKDRIVDTNLMIPEKDSKMENDLKKLEKELN